jgi:PTH1 family peptidyl-tRNA hydrolase
MMVIVGLGNKGKEYQNTRHNIGFVAADKISEHYRFICRKNLKFNAEIADGLIEEQKFLLAKPMTYMNLSGEPVQALCSYYRIKTQNIFVLHDDIDLEVGRIKYKFAGGSGGHNGLNSIDRALGKDYHRIRIGVGRPSTNLDVSDYVLNPFSKDEYETVSSSVQTIVNYFHLLPTGHIEEFQHNVCSKISS